MIGSMSEAFISVVVWGVVWRICHLTAALLLPVLSLGSLLVLSPDAEDQSTAWHGLARDPRGVVSVEANTAALAGGILWVAALAIFLLLRA